MLNLDPGQGFEPRLLKLQITKKNCFLQAITNVVVDCSDAVDGQILKAKPFINLFIYEERQEDTKRVIALSKK